jgi:hypothetical protein
MRDSTNFHPEWGYLAPTQGFIRTARVALVTTAVGAIVGAGVGFSWISHQVTETSVAARTLVRPIDASSSRTNASPQATQMKVLQPTQQQSPLPLASSGQPTSTPSSSESSASPPTQAPEGIAALPEAPSGTDAPVKAATAAPPAAAEAPSVDVTPMKKKVTKKPHVIWRYASCGEAHGHVRGEHFRRGSYYTSVARGGYYPGRWDGYYITLSGLVDLTPPKTHYRLW